MNEDLYSIPLERIDGSSDSLQSYRGKTLLIVNVASQCGFTSQYEGLETLYRRYKDQGFEILGFPCNQFGAQEPDDEATIQTFCERRFGVSFPLFKKIEVNGPHAHPLYVFLKKAAPGLLGSESIKWNFTKFLVSADGSSIRRFAPTDTPDSLERTIQASLPTLTG